MNANQIITMVTRMIMRRVLHKGIDVGVNAMSRRKGGGDTNDDPQLSADARQTSKRARQASKIVRRLGRF